METIHYLKKSEKKRKKKKLYIYKYINKMKSTLDRTVSFRINLLYSSRGEQS